MTEEHALQIECVNLLTIYSQYADFVFFSIPNEALITAANLNKKRMFSLLTHLKKMGMKPGASDLVIGYHGKTYYLECKIPTGIQSDNQILFETYVKKAGFDYYIFTSIAQFVDICSIIFGDKIGKII